MKNTKSYLGDGVYVDIANGMLVLTTEDGIETANTIFLEKSVYDALKRYVDRISPPEETNEP